MSAVVGKRDRQWVANSVAARWDGRRATRDNLPERFWRLAKRGAPNECWLWTGGTGGSITHRYGVLRREAGGSRTTAHRIAYELEVGPIPDGYEIDHLCRVTLCVNPAHLEAVTQYENNMRSDSKTARLARQTHCKRGHPLSGPNLYIDGRGNRSCKTCRGWRAAA